MKSYSLLCLILITSPSFAQGDRPGGGGDTKTELRIKEIRNNILGWINSGRAEKLHFPEGITYERYLKGDGTNPGMIELLQEGRVVVNSISEAQENQNDYELNTRIDGQPKVCKGFLSNRDLRLHILCNVERFERLNAQEQYQQVHHEYAGLGLIEKNTGADSDYFISRQLTDKGEYRTVWMLPIDPEEQSYGKGCVLDVWWVWFRYLKEDQESKLAQGKIVNGYYIRPLLDIGALASAIANGEPTPGAIEADFRLDANFSIHTPRVMIIKHIGTGTSEVARIVPSMIDQLTRGLLHRSPQNQTILEQMKAAKSIAEYERLKAQLDPSQDRTDPPMSKLEAYIHLLPSCKEMLKK